MIRILFLILLASNAFAQEKEFHWERLEDIPESIGLAGPFAGTVGSKLVVGGGANFPDRPPWQGGTKVWHDRVWVLDKTDSNWLEIGRLPKPLAYGVSISTYDGLICVGGSDATRHYPDVFQIQLVDGRITTKPLPSLPHPIANACGAMMGSTIYVAGGTESPTATKTLPFFIALDLTDIGKGWIELNPWPGPGRMLAVSAVANDSFYLISGADLSADREGKPLRHYLTDAFRFQPRSGWTRIPDVSNPCVAAPSPAPSWSANGFVVFGGDDGSNVGFHPVEKHPGFDKRIQVFDASRNKWIQLGYTPAPRVTVPTVQWNERCVIVSGEERPGVRSPQVWSLKTTLSK